jgi:hypothetical protein
MHKKTSVKLPEEMYNYLKESQLELSKKLGFQVSLSDTAKFNAKKLKGEKVEVQMYNKKKRQFFDFKL